MNNYFKQCQQKKKDKRPFLTDEHGSLLLSKLELCAEKNDDDVWELLVEDKIESKKDLKTFAKSNKMPTKSMADADKKSDFGDVGLYKVRYSYQKTSNVPNKDGNKSREFCDKMMNWSKTGLEWRQEDIVAMSEASVNGSFAEKGQSSYDLFLHSGGCYCRHGWLRRIYFRKTDSRGRFLPNKGMTNESRVGNNPFIVQKGSESIAPYDTPNHGKINPPFMKS